MVERRAARFCGQLSMRFRGEPVRVSLCHCRDCQGRTGSSDGIAAFFAGTDVVPEGLSHTDTRSSDSSHALTFQFCPNCANCG